MSDDLMNETQAVMGRDESMLDDAPKLPARGQEHLKSSRRIRNDEKWKSLKDEIYRIYMTEDNTLQTRWMRFLSNMALKQGIFLLTHMQYLIKG